MAPEDDSIWGLDRLVEHVDMLLASPSSPARSSPTSKPGPELDPALFDVVKMQVTQHNASAIGDAVLPRILAVFHTPAIASGQGLLANTEAAASLAEKLLAQPVFSFADALAVAPPGSYLEALRSDTAPAITRLALAVISKAVDEQAVEDRAAEQANLALLAQSPGLFRAFLECWLTCPDTGIGDHAERILLKLLRADRPRQLWRLMLETHDIYACVVLAACRTGLTSPAQATIAQARVLNAVPALLCLNFRAVASGGVDDDDQPSLLAFACAQMVDETDALMLRQLHVFYVGLVRRTCVLLTDSDRRHGIARGRRPPIEKLDDISDPELRFQVETLRRVLGAATRSDAGLLAELRQLPVQASEAGEGERDTATAGEASDMVLWTTLLVSADSTLAVRSQQRT